ncbi:aspartate kinase [Candidatus Micrarchaeota archaeon]|nr:aspartate kinase [Candidatus Micrarchaeota archaeon]
MVTVHKIGGGVLRDASGYRMAAKILKTYGPDNVAVVSALYGVTDRLERCLLDLRQRRLEDGALESFTQTLQKDHLDLLESIQKPEAKRHAQHALGTEMARLNRVLYGVFLLQELTPRTRDLVHSVGERLSRRVLVAFLSDESVPSEGMDADVAGLLTDSRFGNAVPDLQACGQNLSKSILPLAEKNVVVFTGYFGRDAEGHVTTLGRGGSDYSAGIVAHALDAEKLIVWKDVAGFMSADPKVVPGARLIGLLSYDEAEQLGAFGAKIIHPKTIAPLRQKKIPVEIRNTLQPQEVGSRIAEEGRTTQSVAKSVAVRKNACMLTIKGGSLQDVSSVAYPLFDQLRRQDVPIDAISTSQSDLSLCFDAAHLPAIQYALTHAQIPSAAVSVENDAALLALVGEGMKRTVGVSGRLFSALANAGVNIRMICQGASEINITVGVSRTDADKALKAAHGEFIE